MGEICDLTFILGDWDDQKVSHKDGQFTALLFWTTDDPQSTEKMTQIEDMLIYNEIQEWESNVRIVGLNMDSKKDTFKDIVSTFAKYKV